MTLTKNFYEIEAITKEKVIDEVALADTPKAALALAFGGCESDYFESHTWINHKTMYVVLCNGVYEYFLKTE